MATTAGTLQVNVRVDEEVLTAIEDLRQRVGILEEAHQITIDGILRDRIESDAECAKLMRENARLQRELEQALSCDWQGVARDKVTEDYEGRISQFRERNRELEKELRTIASYAEAHHCMQEASMWLHSLTVDIPAMVQRVLQDPQAQ